MKRQIALLLSVIGVSAALFSAPAQAASTFYGTVRHVSTGNIKVVNLRNRQTLSFMILPHFNRVFSANGKTTYQMGSLRPGRYVGVVYDQKVFGIRHADKIYLLSRANQRIGQP
jgi:hypothetical protein